MGHCGGRTGGGGLVVGTPPTIQPLDSIVINPGEGWPSLHMPSSTSATSNNIKEFSSSGGNSSSTTNGLAPLQGKKSRKHTSNVNNSHNSVPHNTIHAGADSGATTNGSSPRQTPTRDQHNNTHKRSGYILLYIISPLHQGVYYFFINIFLLVRIYFYSNELGRK